MKIAIVCPNYPPAASEGGISHYTQRLARHLNALGENVAIMTDDGYGGDGSDEGILVMKFPGEWNLQTAHEMVRLFRSLKVDIVNLQYSPEMYSTSFKFAWQKLTSNFQSTASFHTLWGGSRLNYLIALRLLQSANGIIATNSEIMYLLKKYLPFFLRKTSFVPIGPNIEPSDAKENPREIAVKYSLDPNVPAVAFFGMSYPGKGMNLLFETAKTLWNKYKVTFQLLVIGGGISDALKYREEKMKLISKLGIEGRVIWTGKIPAAEVSALLSRSKVVILPFESGVSDRRGSLMAAIAHHKAVVTTKPAVPVSLFKNGENMIWPAKSDTIAFVEALARVLQDDELRLKVESGAAELSRHFEWPDIAKKTRACFLELMEKKGGFSDR
jgi:glycosyltransferase involved in cell wall biosynthesis